jgi:hypothetical protein
MTVVKHRDLCNLTTAFDCVIHDILFDKLVLYRICDKIIMCFKSYMQNRTGRVMLLWEVTNRVKLGNYKIWSKAGLNSGSFLVLTINQ